ncbi:TerB family tellurite resistance protein [Cytophagales bacterium LB-30]|uniref:TerB family tellurite resistance protein n=2 Tax=Shiella aurantiaca TaxID=3058365 RepID=A0ABT8F0D4_9BACT|nr:TerB family tellurite resistance protein [Shiella aurantiaca]
MVQTQLKMLIQLATTDNELAEKEVKMIHQIGKANGLTDEEVDELMKNPRPLGPLDTLSEDQRFEYLYSLVQLMKIDGKVYKSEIVFCEEMSEKLGYKKAAVSELSAKIYSDPSITSDRESLKAKLRKLSNR